ncbi:MAG TPA: sialidase family protein [Ktedonobacterales bacterium]
MRRHAAPSASALLTLSLTLALTLAACAANPTGAYTAATATPRATPVNLPAAWKSSTPPTAAEDIQFAPSRPSLAYLCADNGPAAGSLTSTPRLYVSYGGEWYSVSAPAMAAISDPATVAASCAIFIDAQNSKDIFYQEAVNELQGAGHVIRQALYRSQDGGATWRTLATVASGAGFASVAVVGSRLVGRVYPIYYGAASCTSMPKPKASTLLYASDDGGATWNPIGQTLESAGYALTDMAVAGTTIFAVATQVPAAACQQSAGAALWRSTDGGATWASTALSEPGIQSVSFTRRADGSSYDGVVVATTANGSPIELFSQDSGATWTLLSALSTTPTANSSGGAPTGGYINALVSPTGVVVAQEDGGANTDILDATSATPRWTPYAAGSQDRSDNWRLQPLAQGARVWALQYVFSPTPQASALTYLTLP